MTMLGTMLFLALATTGQLPAADRPAIPTPVVSKPGEVHAKQWLDVASPIDGALLKILAWREAGGIRFDAREYPQLVPATPPGPLASTASATNTPQPTGVVFSKFPQVEAGHSWTGGNAPQAVTGHSDKVTTPEVYLAIIGSKRDRERVKADLARDPSFSALARDMGGRLAVEAYDPTNPLVADVGLVGSGRPDIVVLDAGGKEIARFPENPGSGPIAEAVRKADPSYRPGGGQSQPSGGTGIGWLLIGAVAVIFIFRSQRAP
jgi:hypothetical protein